MFPERLKHLRSQKGLTQDDVATALGVSRATIAGYESGKKREPDYETLNRIADFFNVSIDYLLGRTDDPTPPDASRPKKKINLDDPLMDLAFRRIPKMTPKMRKSLEALLELTEEMDKPREDDSGKEDEKPSK